MHSAKRKIVAILILIFTIFSADELSANQGNPIGAPTTTIESRTDVKGASATEQSLTQVANEFGRIRLSLDAMGTSASSGIVQVDKPAGATVRKAYLMAATTGFREFQLNSGDVRLEGNTVVWEREIANSIQSFNYWADVTAIVKPIVDAAPEGLVDLEIAEADSDEIEGEILAVIFDDPNQTTENTVLLYFGAQNVDGDSFVIELGAPIDKTDPNLRLDYSLGISYGCQGACGNTDLQYSVVDVNGNRLTSSAGGQDDGELVNGALITVGGIGDSVDNPSNPAAPPTDARSDDELYDLRPFVQNSDTSIQIDTLNPSDDDNILFAAISLATTRSIGTIDLDITLYNNPTSDSERDPYEAMIDFFADGVFEASNGAHKIGKVTFHPNNTNSSTSDVIWVEKCHPSAWPAGIAEDGLHINMCDIFEGGGSGGSDYDFLSTTDTQRMGGYTLAHEWGHYYYTLFDEYVGAKKNDNIFHFPHSTDIGVSNSIMNSQWNAYSTAGNNYNWLNFSVQKNDTKKNAQYRIYGATAWETLTRPVSEDPRDGERVSQPERIHYAELTEVSTGEKEDATIELPGNARSALRVVWSDAVVASEMSSPSQLTYETQLTSVLGQNISYPDPILLLAFVHSDAPITDLTIGASVQQPDGRTELVRFTDDGIAPDAEAGDGLYSAILGYEEDGIYVIAVEFQGTADRSQRTYVGFAPATGIDGPLPLPSSVPIDEDFRLTDEVEVSVSNTAIDDFGDTPVEAELLVANNQPSPGKINAPGDRDVFAIPVQSPTATYIRIDNLALGIDPRLRVFGADQTSLLFDSAIEPGFGTYIYAVIRDATAGTTLFAEVSDVAASAQGGLYEISAGGRLKSDAPHTTIFLPSIAGGGGRP